MDVIELIGRVMFAATFVLYGVPHLTEREGRVAYARSAGVPAANALVPATGVMIIAGGLMVALGAWADLGAVLIAAFLIPTAYFMHGFWRYDDPQERMNQNTHFMKNISLAGAALVIFYLYQQFGDDIGLNLTDPLFYS